MVESIWPMDGFEEGLGINALVSADPAPPAGGAVFHDTAVWLRPEPAPLEDVLSGARGSLLPAR